MAFQPVKALAGDDRYRVRAVTRALDVLLAFRELKSPVDLMTVARHVGLHPTSAYRYLESLRSRGLIRAAGEGGYELGPGVFELSAAFLGGLTVWAQAADLTQRLAVQANETASIGVLDGGEVLYIAISNGQRELGIQSQAGSRHPAHCTALGKAILADLSRGEVAAILDAHPPVPLTPRTIVTLEDLQADLETVRARGFSLDDEERTTGVLCIGAPIRDYTGRVVAAVSLSGPTFRLFGAERRRVTSLVVAAAADATLRLGGTPSLLPDTTDQLAPTTSVRTGEA